jgi:hypothetical protein
MAIMIRSTSVGGRSLINLEISKAPSFLVFHRRLKVLQLPLRVGGLRCCYTPKRPHPRGTAFCFPRRARLVNATPAKNLARYGDLALHVSEGGDIRTSLHAEAASPQRQKAPSKESAFFLVSKSYRRFREAPEDWIGTALCRVLRLRRRHFSASDKTHSLAPISLELPAGLSQASLRASRAG